MAKITLDGQPAETNGSIPQKGDGLKDFRLVDTNLQVRSLRDYEGKKLVIYVFPSVGTGVCSASLKQFDKKAASLENTVVLNISKDLPFALKSFCVNEGLENVEMLSDFRYNQFGEDYHTQITSGAFEGLLSRAVIVADENQKVVYSEQVPEIGQEPDYEAALEALKSI